LFSGENILIIIENQEENKSNSNCIEQGYTHYGEALNFEESEVESTSLQYNLMHARVVLAFSGGV